MTMTMMLMMTMIMTLALTAGWRLPLPRHQVDVLELVHDAWREDVHGLGQEQQLTHSLVNGSLLPLPLLLLLVAAAVGLFVLLLLVCLAASVAAVHHACDALQAG
jgi:hypothetical protein